jgi:uncharacterized membrane protein HdeD (DUF308 family)
MKKQDIQNLQDALENVQSLETLEQKEAVLKQLKSQIRKLEIAVIAIGLVILSLIVLPFFSLISFSVISILSIIGGTALIIKAFKDGEVLETEKFFLLISISNDKNQDKDGE